MKKQLSSSIKRADESAREFVEAWRRAEAGKSPAQPIERLYFEDLATMLKVLAPARCEVLKVLRRSGPVSVRALAAKMKPDYKNVHYDFHVLERVGLVTSSADGRLTAPWEKIIPKQLWLLKSADRAGGLASPKNSPQGAETLVNW